jgi:hypothetical protein
MEVAQPGSQRAQFVSKFGCKRGGQHDRVACDVEKLAVVHQLLQQRLLRLADGVVEKLVDLLHVDPARWLQQPGERCRVAEGGGGVGKVACVFIDAERQQRCLHRRHGNAVLDQLLDQQRGVGAGVVAPKLAGLRQQLARLRLVAARRGQVMVDDDILGVGLGAPG